jgi:hypothetical protein
VGGKAAVVAAALENSELRELHSRLYWQCQHDTQFPVGSAAEFISWPKTERAPFGGGFILRGGNFNWPD